MDFNSEKYNDPCSPCEEKKEVWKPCFYKEIECEEHRETEHHEYKEEKHDYGCQKRRCCCFLIKLCNYFRK